MILHIVTLLAVASLQPSVGTVPVPKEAMGKLNHNFYELSGSKEISGCILRGFYPDKEYCAVCNVLTASYLVISNYRIPIWSILRANCLFKLSNTKFMLYFIVIKI
jgi:hypothetical protein